MVTKSIQNLANLIEFKAKESFMIYLNPFIKKYTPSMREFINDISVSKKKLWYRGRKYNMQEL